MTTSAQPVSWTPAYPTRTPPPVWGDSHWRCLQFVEERCVNNQGTLSPEWMRINPEVHYQQFAQGRAARAARGDRVEEDFTPSTVKAATYPGRDGRFAHRALVGHDEYDCLDDIGYFGYVLCTWPRLTADGTYKGAFGTVSDGKRPITNANLSPEDISNHLMLHSRWRLTERGWKAVFALRRHLAEGGRHHDFIAPEQ